MEGTVFKDISQIIVNANHTIGVTRISNIDNEKIKAHYSMARYNFGHLKQAMAVFEALQKGTWCRTWKIDDAEILLPIDDLLPMIFRINRFNYITKAAEDEHVYCVVPSGDIYLTETVCGRCHRQLAPRDWLRHGNEFLCHECYTIYKRSLEFGGLEDIK